MIAPPNKPKRASSVGAIMLLGSLALSACTTFKPPQISYDDNVPLLPDLPTLADDRERPLHIPPPWIPAQGGKKGDAEEKEPVTRIEAGPTPPRGSNHGGQDTSMPFKSFRIVRARCIRSMPHPGKSRISRSSQASN
jgi:hypothetical protein